MYFKEKYTNTKQYRTSKGKNNIIKDFTHLLSEGVPVTIVYNYFGFGPHIQALVVVMETYNNRTFSVVDWNSFEYYLYSKYRVTESTKAVNSSNYANKEHLAEELLIDTIPTYSKSNLGCISNKFRKICSQCAMINVCKVRTVDSISDTNTTNLFN